LCKLLCFILARSFNKPLSYNKPKFCPTAAWNPNGITFATQTIVGKSPLAIFVNTNNTLYVANRDTNQILVLFNDSTIPTKIISGILTDPHSIFILNTGDLYIDNGRLNSRVDKWISNTNTFATVMNVESSCEGLFVDINDTLYCSMLARHKVVKRSLNDNLMTTTIAAGTGTQSSAANELSSPMGIFVDVNFDLYVADCGNHRIQLFPFGKSNGTTIAGDESLLVTFTLNCPSGIVLDGNRYMFIVDNVNHRIVGSGPYGFRCLVGCDGQGSQSHQLSIPFTLSFDSYGNMFISDQDNHRIQKFVLSTNSCSKFEIVE
jgi:hypothetical protein